MFNSYLFIHFLETTVIAKKSIPKRSQFGPLEGVLVTADNDPAVLKKLEENKLIFLIETEGVLFRIDVADESLFNLIILAFITLILIVFTDHSNWMMFVRQAMSFEEQNLVISQENNAIYFTTTTNIQPKQELKVGNNF